MNREVLVYIDLEGKPALVGRLWARTHRERQSATFEHDKSWLNHPERFSLEPALRLGPGPFHTPSDRPLFGAIGDSAPDRWGRVLMRRAERRRAERERRSPRTLREIDFLLLVDDEAASRVSSRTLLRDSSKQRRHRGFESMLRAAILDTQNQINQYQDLAPR
jgi:serine/threonine-protein kinase HipA